MSMEDLPVIRRIDTDRSDAYAFAVIGTLSDAALENLYGLLDAAYDEHDKIDLLVDMTGLEGMDWGSAFSKETLAIRKASMSHLRRYAIIGGPLWVSASVNLARPFIALEVKHFSADQRDQAWQWIEAQPA